MCFCFLLADGVFQYDIRKEYPIAAGFRVLLLLSGATTGRRSMGRKYGNSNSLPGSVRVARRTKHRPERRGRGRDWLRRAGFRGSVWVFPGPVAGFVGEFRCFGCRFSMRYGAGLVSGSVGRLILGRNPRPGGEQGCAALAGAG